MVTTTTTRRCSSIMVVLPTWLCVFIREGEDSKVNYDLIWSPRHPRHLVFFGRWEREDTQPGITDTHLPDDDLLFDKSLWAEISKRRNRKSDLVDVDMAHLWCLFSIGLAANFGFYCPRLALIFGTTLSDSKMDLLLNRFHYQSMVKVSR